MCVQVHATWSKGSVKRSSGPSQLTKQSSSDIHIHKCPLPTVHIWVSLHAIAQVLRWDEEWNKHLLFDPICWPMVWRYLVGMAISLVLPSADLLPKDFARENIIKISYLSLSVLRCGLGHFRWMA